MYTASVTINIAVDPIAGITTSAVGDTICGGLDGLNQPFSDSLTISTTLIPGASYQYSIDGVPISAVLAGVNSFTTDNFSIYDGDLHFVVGVTVINSNGCSDTATRTINMNYVRADGMN